MISVEDAKYLLKTTIKYVKNRGDLIFDDCVHFSWDKSKQRAENLLGKNADDRKTYRCRRCNYVCDHKTFEKIDNIVVYLNAGGRNERKLKKWFSGVEISEQAVLYPGREVGNGAFADFSLEWLDKSFGTKPL